MYWMPSLLAEYSIPLPAGSTAFSAPQQLAGTNTLLATVSNKTAGDGGFVQFDLEGESATVFPIPSGFSAMELVSPFVATNKLAARGLVQGTSNFQLLIFDLGTGNVSMVQNPDGVASFGPPVAIAVRIRYARASDSGGKSEVQHSGRSSL